MGRKSKKGERAKHHATSPGILQTNDDITADAKRVEDSGSAGRPHDSAALLVNVDKPPIVVSDDSDKHIAQRNCEDDASESDVVLISPPPPLTYPPAHQVDVLIPSQLDDLSQSTSSAPAVSGYVLTDDSPPELALLRDRLEMVSHKLINSQNQIDHLLEEKRVWLQASSSANQQLQQQQQAMLAGAGGELRGRWMQAVAQAETYKREKENMVVKYAQSEQRCLQLQRRLNDLEKRTTAPTTSHSEASPPFQTSPPSNHPASSANGDLQAHLNRTEKALTDALGQLEVQKKSLSLNATRIDSLEAKLIQSYDSIRSEQRKVSAHQETINRLYRSLDAASKQQKEIERLREREAERLCTEVAYEESQEKIKRLEGDNAGLIDKLSDLDSLRAEVQDAEERLTRLRSENTRLSLLVQDLDDCKKREVDLTEFIRRLTTQNTELQAEKLSLSVRLTEAHKRLDSLEGTMLESVQERDQKMERQNSTCKELEGQVYDLQSQLNRSLENETALAAQLNSVREESKLKHNRDVARMRDLTRQLSRMAARLNTPSSSTPVHATSNGNSHLGDDRSDRCSIGKSTNLSPSCSLHSLESSNEQSGNKLILGNTMMATGRTWSVPSSPPSPTKSQISSVAPDAAGFDEDERTAWLAKLDRLQRSQIRLTDKVEFLQEHCAQLTEELNKKSRIIQSFVMHERQIGAAAPSSVDLNKEQIIKTGGLMASIFAGSTNSKSGTLDLETCLNICQKLQSVLEDTLFKNITLKDNLNTLGGEISNLNQSIVQIRKGLCENCRIRTENIK